MDWTKQKFKISGDCFCFLSILLFFIIIDLQISRSAQSTVTTTQNVSEVAVDPAALWPFSNEEDCEYVDTRHTAAKKLHRINKASENVTLLNTEFCGLNKFSNQFRKYRKLTADGRRKHRRSKRASKRTQRRMNMDSRIVGGTEAGTATWPWIVSLGNASTGLTCGGTIINERWIVSAAHCFADREQPCKINVRAGTNYWLVDWQNTSVDSTAEDIFKHPDYDSSTMENDIALVKLKTQLVLDKDGYINSICVPEAAKSVRIGGSTKAAGWGVLDQQSSVLPNELYEVDMTVYEYQGTCSINPIVMANGSVCAGSMSGGEDTCLGDSGGPMAFTKDNVWYLLGITSWGMGCGNKLLPGMYTDIGFHYDWIISTISTYS